MARRRTGPSSRVAPPNSRSATYSALLSAVPPCAAVWCTACSSFALIGGQRFEDLHPVGEADDGAAVALAQRTQEVDGRLVDDIHLVGHAGARVDHQDQVDRNLGGLEEADLLLHAVLEDGEVLPGQSVTNLRPAPSSTLTFSATRLAPLRKTASLFVSLFGGRGCWGTWRAPIGAARMRARAAARTRRGTTSSCFAVPSKRCSERRRPWNAPENPFGRRATGTRYVITPAVRYSGELRPAGSRRRRQQT